VTRPNFSSEVRLGDVLTVVSIVIAGFGWWGNFSAEIAGIKSSQAAQAMQGQRLDASIQEVRQEVKATGQDVRDLRSRMDRARM
jgi:hypothetical protein